MSIISFNGRPLILCAAHHRQLSVQFPASLSLSSTSVHMKLIITGYYTEPQQVLDEPTGPVFLT